MRICLLSILYPPINTEGIARQRQILATELVRQGHEVHVITSGPFSRTRIERGVHVHCMAIDPLPVYSEQFSRLNPMIARSSALYEGMIQAADGGAFDIVDYPLWSAQGFVTGHFGNSNTVIWLQTTLAQLIKLNGRPASLDENAIMALEKMCLEQADGVLADSNSILDEVKQDYRLSLNAPSGIAHLGLPRAVQKPRLPDRKQVHALVVGRLEKRKGTQFLFKILPQLLRRHPQLHVNFVGRDNSQADGWQAAHAATYSQFFQKQFPGLAERVHFHDYVSEKDLAEFYRNSDLLLVPSLYESFGLIYLEAMRVCLPVVTFEVGAAMEIFPHRERDGALITPLENGAKFMTAVGRLVENKDVRFEIGQRGLMRFEEAFTAEEMANATLRFYEKVMHSSTRNVRNSTKIYQVMEAVDAGDAVSTITIRNADVLKTLGQPQTILTRFANEHVRHFTSSRNTILDDPACGLIFHYWGYNHSTWMLPLVQGRKALYYHNITPPRYFSADTPNFHGTTQGYAQLAQIVNRFDLLIGDSQFNIDCLAEFLSEPKPSLVIPPIVDVKQLRTARCDPLALTQLNVPGQENILFVGRVARNKRQDLLMRAFEHYYCEINPHAHLWLVGRDNGDPLYRAELENLRLSLKSGAQIHFTGKVEDEIVNAHYRTAHVFLSASEHEGFGMPLIEAMAHDIPVIAYASSAVPETIGKGGALVYDWDTAQVAELMRRVFQDHTWRQTILNEQTANLDRFTQRNAKIRIETAVNFLRKGQESPLIKTTYPERKRTKTSFVGKSINILGTKTQPVIPYMIAFTPRCGSTLLCQYLEVNGLGKPTEYFQYPYGVQNRWAYENLGVPKNDFRKFIQELIKHYSANGMFGAKVLWGHKNVLLRKVQKLEPSIQTFEDIFPGMKWLQIERQDKIAQAVSFWRAARSGRWHSPDKATKRRLPKYNFRQIKIYYNAIIAEEKKWTSYFQSLNISPLRFTYECLLTNPPEVLVNIADYIQAPTSVLPSASRVKIEAQLGVLRDSYSEEIKTRFIQDLNKTG